MSELLEFYRCDICGHIIQILHKGNGELVCCGQPMKLLVASGTSEEKNEKHVPVFTNDNKIIVGSEPHPMTKEHHIEFIESISEDKKHLEICFLDFSDKPEMKLNNNLLYKNAFEYCNLHGLWKGNR